MNKIIKFILSIFICVIIFFCGFFISNKQRLQNTSNVSALTNNLDENNYNNDTNEDAFPSLTESEVIFLEEYLFGQWRFSERLFELDDSQNIVYNTTYNLSDIGVEELKENIIMLYEKDWIQFAVPVTQNAFTSAKDMFLFGKNGGFLSIKEPVYTIGKMDSDTINLSNICTDGEEYDVQFVRANDFLKVTYYTPFKKGEYDQKKVGTDFGHTIYINPNDKNTIYVDFCGLWRMERDNEYYGPSGKSGY